MSLNDIILMAINNLKRRKIRTFLTVIGIIIGTISIVVMMSIGIALNTAITKDLLQSGSLTTIDVMPRYTQNPKDKVKLDKKLQDKIRQISNVQEVVPVYKSDVKLVKGNFRAYINLDVIPFEAFYTFDKFAGILNDIKKGNMYIGKNYEESFYSEDYTRQAPTVNFTKDSVKLAFVDMKTGELGKKFRINKFVVIGSEENAFNMFMYSAFMDYETYLKLAKNYANTLKYSDRKQFLEKIETPEKLWVKAKSFKTVENIEKELQAMDLETSSVASQMSSMKKLTGTIQLILIGIGAISMLVSAVNITNTMIMSIYERTKEIGIMKVLGCYVTDIEKLFLVEAGIMGIIGGVIGILFSYIISFILNKIGKGFLTANVVEASTISIIPIWLAVLAILFSMLVGVLSGYYPARKATKIRAIEAIKSE